MASPAKADSASGSPNPPDALQLAAAAGNNPGLTVNTGTRPYTHDPAVSPPTPSTVGTPVVVADDPDDVPVAKPSTFSCGDDIKLVMEHTKEITHIAIDTLERDYDRKHGQIRKLTAKLWKDIMATFGVTPPMQPGNVVVLERSSMPTSVTRT